MNGSSSNFSFSSSASDLDDPDQAALVQTPYGTAMVLRTRTRHNDNDDDVDDTTIVSRELMLTEWKQAAPKGGPANNKPVMLYSCEAFPSVPPQVGNDVMCPLLGRGKVISVDAQKGLVTVQISKWRLANRSRVTCSLPVNQVQVVRPKTLYEMKNNSVWERIELAQQYKQEAKPYFVKKEFDQALNQYAKAIDAVRYVQHDKNSDNYARADLLVVMITCCNNAATCAHSMATGADTAATAATATDGGHNKQQWDIVQRYAQNALVLIEALEQKVNGHQKTTTRSKIMEILERDGFTAEKIFGEWKTKSLCFLAKAAMENKDYEKAMTFCKQVQDIATKKNSSVNVSGNSSVNDSSNDSGNYSQNKVVLHNYREARQIHVKCKEQQSITKKKEKQRAQAMFAGGSSNSVNGSSNGKINNGSHVNPATENGAGNNSNKNHSNHGMNNSSKRVTFEDGGTPRDAYYGNSSDDNTDNDVDSDNNTEDDQEQAMPWYQEHQELMILMGGLAVVGLGVSQLLSLTSRRSGR